MWVSRKHLFQCCRFKPISTNVALKKEFICHWRVFWGFFNFYFKTFFLKYWIEFFQLFRFSDLFFSNNILQRCRNVGFNFLKFLAFLTRRRNMNKKIELQCFIRISFLHTSLFQKYCLNYWICYLYYQIRVLVGFLLLSSA